VACVSVARASSDPACLRVGRRPPEDGVRPWQLLRLQCGVYCRMPSVGADIQQASILLLLERLRCNSTR